VPSLDVLADVLAIALAAPSSVLLAPPLTSLDAAVVLNAGAGFCETAETLALVLTFALV